MSKGRNLTKKKWRNGQRQKGSDICDMYIPPQFSKMIRSWCSDKGHGRKRRTKFPRTDKFLSRYEGNKISMKMPYYFVRRFNPCLTNLIP